MRSRYSRRIYSMKFGTERSDFIDDEDIRFLENLSSFHRTYIDNQQKKLNLDVSLLPPKFVRIYENISKHYSLVKTSEKKSELYHNFDLRYEGEEFHIRNIREQIINYLDNKKHQIFTNHRVEFFINIALNTKFEKLRDICREMTFNMNSNNKRIVFDDADKKSFNKLRLNGAKPERKMPDGGHKMSMDTIRQIIERIQDSGEGDESVINDVILHNFAKMDTLLFPYIKMYHPHTELDYESAERFIAETAANGDDGGCDDDLVISPLDVDARDVDDCAASPTDAQKSSPSPSPVAMPTLLEYSSVVNDANSADLSVLPPLRPSSEIIEISDEEDDDNDSGGVRPEEPQPRLNHSDIDQMIDFLIHRCNIQPDRHPSLLNDRQMHVELNGFLLFVNFSIRLSLRYSLDSRDRRIFDCIFISSLIVGLTCLVSMNEHGIAIEQLTDDGCRIVRTRLRSVELAANDVRRVGESYSVLINPDITRLMQLTLFYVRGYHEFGELREK